MSYGTFWPWFKHTFSDIHPCDLAKRSGSQVEDVLPFFSLNTGSGVGAWNHLDLYIQHHIAQIKIDHTFLPMFLRHCSSCLQIRLQWQTNLNPTYLLSSTQLVVHPPIHPSTSPHSPPSPAKPEHPRHSSHLARIYTYITSVALFISFSFHFSRQVPVYAPQVSVPFILFPPPPFLVPFFHVSMYVLFLLWCLPFFAGCCLLR